MSVFSVAFTTEDLFIFINREVNEKIISKCEKKEQMTYTKRTYEC